ncbi:MAG TPA: HlyD family efflux transporter periplasmic adaptor subunit [Mycobacteriales bacterium]|nr:HlyD family efflux transporter periplasmic adaptor subunit [Mycobacteriales bacterium]
MRRPGFGVAAVVAVVLGVSGCTGDGNAGIELGTVDRATVTEVVEAPANVQARATVTVTATGDGTVGKLYVTDGQRVPAGAILAVISAPDAQTRLRTTRAQAAQAEAAAPTSPPRIDLGASQGQADTSAKGAFDAARRAAGQIPDARLKAAALAQITAAEKQYALARAQAQAAIEAINTGVGNLSTALGALTAAQRGQAEAAVTAAQRAVDALTIRAPIAGVVQLGGTAGSGSSSGSLGSVLDQLPPEVRDQASSALGTDVSGGSAPQVQTTGPVTAGMPVSTGLPLATIVDTAVLSLIAEVDETDVLLVRRGVHAAAELDAVPGASYPATVQAVDLSPTASARGGVSYRVRLTLGHGKLADGRPAPDPRPGMSAVADLQVRTARDAISVPSSAVTRVGNLDAVWVVAGGRAARRTVTVGTQGEDLVEITKGLIPGERVVVRGADKVSAGQTLS